MHRKEVMLDPDDPRARVQDQDRWSELIKAEFKHKWSCHLLQQRDVINAVLHAKGGAGVNLTDQDVAGAVGCLKQGQKLDG